MDYLGYNGKANAYEYLNNCDYDSLFDDFDAPPDECTVAEDTTMDCSASHTETEEFFSFAE
ncbi:unnamed protein product [Penicillium salamii]|uniref:Uncharacterized protein n=1 Tax=Penicillium salamii TaxID=1612424 RepID=A0A9W4I4P7_9EURO|nr:unnamed protein product [Penicillium salamii]